jgi:hypothetical protein
MYYPFHSKVNTWYGKQLNDIGLEGSPSRIVVVPDKEEAIVTLPDENFMQIINTVQ